MKKGISSFVEASIGAIIILFFLFLTYRPLSFTDLSPFENKLLIFNAIKSLDSTGKLRQAVISNDTKTIENLLSNYIPSSVNFKVAVCFENCPNLEINATNVYSITYFFAGNYTNLKPARLIVYVW
jgi:predicted oxidoreductase